MNVVLSKPVPMSENQEATQHTIVICEANPILADGLRHLLRKDSYLSKYSVTLLEKTDFSKLKKLPPDILIVDPWQNSDSWQSTSAAFLDLAKTTALIGYCPDVMATEARALGLVGFRGIMPKTISSEDLVRIVCSVAFGGTYIHEIYTDSSIYPAASNTLCSVSPPDLTEREFEVLRHVALGSSMKEIAAVLNISTKTVDTYKTRANQKLNLRSRSDIVRFAIQSGWMN